MTTETNAVTTPAMPESDALIVRASLEILRNYRDNLGAAAFRGDADAARRCSRVAGAVDTAVDVLQSALITAQVYCGDYILGVKP